jgi:hypothetical protein
MSGFSINVSVVPETDKKARPYCNRRAPANTIIYPLPVHTVLKSPDKSKLHVKAGSR